MYNILKVIANRFAMQIPQYIMQDINTDPSHRNRVHGAYLGLSVPTPRYTQEQVHSMQATCRAADVDPPVRAAP